MSKVNFKKLLKVLKKIGLVILFLFYFSLLFLLIWAASRIFVGKLPILFIDEMFLGILILPVAILSPAIYLLLKKERLTAKFIVVWLLIISVVINLSWIHLRLYRPKLVKNTRAYCEKLAEEEGVKEAEKKGYHEGSDTYFVVSRLTKEREFSECLYKKGIINVEPEGWTFDWIPNAGSPQE